jgi:hypothetical protein
MQRKFCELLVSEPQLTQLQVYERAGYSTRNKRAAEVEACRILNLPHVLAYLQDLRAKVAARTGVDQDRIVAELLRVVHADPNELVEYRRTCCRFCWSFGCGYKRTPEEMKAGRQAHERSELAAQQQATKGKPHEPKAFDEMGGDDYDHTKPPDPDCTECRGEGVGSALFKDTAKASPAARALYAGVKITKDGTQLLMHSKEGFLQLLMRQQGMLRDKVELGGKDGGPVQIVMSNGDENL